MPPKGVLLCVKCKQYSHNVNEDRLCRICVDKSIGSASDCIILPTGENSTNDIIQASNNESIYVSSSEYKSHVEASDLRSILSLRDDQIDVMNESLVRNSLKILLSHFNEFDLLYEDRIPNHEIFESADDKTKIDFLFQSYSSIRGAISDLKKSNSLLRKQNDDLWRKANNNQVEANIPKSSSLSYSDCLKNKNMTSNQINTHPTRKDKKIGESSQILFVENPHLDRNALISKEQVSQIKANIKNILDVSKNKIQIDEIIPLNSKGVKLTFPTESMREKAFDLLDGKKDESSLHPRKHTKINPRITIKGIPSEISSINLIDTIRLQNQEIDNFTLIFLLFLELTNFLVSYYLFLADGYQWKPIYSNRISYNISCPRKVCYYV